MANELIAKLLAIKEFSKDIHYNVNGECAISLHKFADEVGEDMSGFIDDIKENILLGHNKRPLGSKEYMQRAIILIPDVKGDNKANYQLMMNLIDETLNYIDTINSFDKGSENLIGNIAENLQKSKGLINLIIG